MTFLENAYALVLGIANYTQINSLPTTVLNDARAIYRALVDKSGCAYPIENVQLLLDDAATQDALRQAFADLSTKTNGDSTVLIYVSSHGARLDSGAYAGDYLLPVDARYDSSHSLAQTAISGAEFSAALRAIPARKLVVVLDCCHAGGSRANRKMRRRAQDRSFGSVPGHAQRRARPGDPGLVAQQ